jgi:hypothetical protein
MDNSSETSGKPVRIVEGKPQGLGSKEVAVLPRADTLFGSVCVRGLSVPAPAPFVPCNPSVVWTGSRWLCSVRAVDYRLGVPSKTGSSSKNYLAVLRDDLSTESVRELVDTTESPRNARSLVKGFEDLRLYMRGQQVWALATACDLVNGGAQPEMCRLQIDADSSEIVDIRPMRGPWSRYPQKNWMVVADGQGARAIYRVAPSLVIHPEVIAHEWASVDSAYTLMDEHDFIPSMIRGSSQVLPCGDGWLCVVHEHVCKAPVVYGHRFVWLDSGFGIGRVSEAFAWERVGVEFCAGMAIRDQRLVVSYGVQDRSAKIVELELGAVLAKMRPFQT